MNRLRIFGTTALLLGYIFTASGCSSTAGETNAVNFNGPISGDSVRYMIYLPPDYDRSESRYPVIYFLHGMDGDEASDYEVVVPVLERAVAAGIVKPMIVVFANGYRNSCWADSKSGHKRAETNVIRELVPHIDATYRTHAEAKHRIIQGMSMGGYGAMLYATKYPELFGICINYDGGFPDEEMLLSSQTKNIFFEEIFGSDMEYFKEYSPWAYADSNRDIIHEEVAIRSVVGSLVEQNRNFHEWLREVDVMQEYVETGLGHDLKALLEKEWEDDYYFIGERLGGGHESGTLRDGKSHYRVFTGPISGARVEYNIYLPKGYVGGDKRYPVIYHLHGAAVNQDCDDDMVPAGLERAVEAGIVEPMIIVFANGYRNSRWADSPDGKKPAETNVIRELIPYVDTHYRTKADRTHRVIQGFSMGGSGAMAYITKYPQLFAVCITYDGGFFRRDSRPGGAPGGERRAPAHNPWQNAEKNLDTIKANCAIRMIAGAFRERNGTILDHLRDLGIPVNYVQTDCGHDMYCMTDEQWEETYTFIAENLGDGRK
jgi:enterochelin esterase-like enzyme